MGLRILTQGEEAMKSLEELKNRLAAHKAELWERYRVKEIGLFGSFVRGEVSERSDVDLLVDFDKPIGLFEFQELEEYLSQILGLRVDLVSRKALKPHIGKHILDEIVPV